ncbi:NAD(P)H-binding protein [Actinoplanes siamensis]|uniref:NmrA family transcriptional regulator n=1 Tax=Actinoplanes siamensis TaxID=1223317 RepID=A0A919TN06_9ACTN|nr:NAD(P)H-binding protein [Actinoplanes siamensis]GIF07555.1 NmrA family transcriptional regulator [Actinoplanes siamensis]
MIVVTGATGRLGSRIVDQLLERVPAERVAVSVRDTAKAAGLTERGVRVRRGDFTEPAALAHAFEAAEQVLVISAAIRGDGAFVANRAAIDAAQRAGARRILYTSHQAASPDSLFGAQPVHAATEAYLAGTGVPFTALRNGFYTNTIPMQIGDALQTGRLLLPQDGPFSWTDHADLAEAAAIALTEEGALDGVTPPLTAPELLDFADVARLLTELTGRTVTRVVIGDEEWKAAAVDGGYPPVAAEFMLGMFRAARRGEFAVTDPALEKLTGHPATSVRTILERFLADA